MAQMDVVGADCVVALVDLQKDFLAGVRWFGEFGGDDGPLRDVLPDDDLVVARGIFGGHDADADCLGNHVNEGYVGVVSVIESV